MKKSRIFIIFAAVFFVFCVFGLPKETQAAESGGISWTYESGILTLTGEGDMTDVSYAGSTPWQQYASFATEIRIEKGITSVGERSFYGFTALKSIVLADSISEIGAHAFSGCTSLEAVQYPAYLKAIGEGAFNGCSSLTSAVLPSSMRSLGAYAYASCTSLKSVNLPASLGEIGAYAFFGATTLESVQLPATLKNIPDSCFRACPSLSAISLPTLLEEIGSYAFYGCSSLVSLPLPDGVLKIGTYALAESALTSIHLSEKLQEIGAYAFSSCTELVNVDLPKKLKSIPDGLFFSCKKIEKIEFPTALESIGADAFSYCLALGELTIPRNVRSIGAHAFSYANSLQKVTFQSVNCFVAGSTAAPIFRSCVALSEVEFGAEVSVIPSALCYGLTALTQVSMGASVREIGASAFEGCTSLAEIRLSEMLGRVGESAFYRCQSLKNLYLPLSITVAGRYAFYTDKDARLYLANDRTPTGFSEGWHGENSVYFSGEWVKCSFDAAGKTLAELYLPLGESASEPTVDSYEPRKGYTAYFAGWDLNGDGKADSIPLQVWSSFCAVALFREIPNKYLCRFFDDDGSLLAEYSLYYDSEITLPASPEKASDGLYEYYFSSWSGYEEGMTVSGDHDFTAVYRAVLLDLTAPTVLGIENGEVYYAAREVEIYDDGGLQSVTFDGQEQPITLGKVQILLPADGKSHRIVAIDQAGWETVIEVRGINVSHLIDAMPKKEAAALGAEEELLRVFDEIDTLLQKAITENDRIALQTRREELFSAYQKAAAATSFSFLFDGGSPFTEESVKAAFLHLFGTAETQLALEGYQVEFEISVRKISLPTENDQYKLLADSQGKKIKEGYLVRVFRCLTAPDGLKTKEEITTFANVQYTFSLSKEAQEKGITFAWAIGDQAENLTWNENGTASFSFSTPFTLLVLEEPSRSISWPALLFLVIGMSLVTSLSLAFFARYMVRRRVRSGKTTHELEEINTQMMLENTDDFEENVKKDNDAFLEELYAPQTEDLESEGFSLQKEDAQDFDADEYVIDLSPEKEEAEGTENVTEEKEEKEEKEEN